MIVYVIFCQDIETNNIIFIDRVTSSEDYAQAICDKFNAEKSIGTNWSYSDYYVF